MYPKGQLDIYHVMQQKNGKRIKIISGEYILFPQIPTHLLALKSIEQQ